MKSGARDLALLQPGNHIQKAPKSETMRPMMANGTTGPPYGRFLCFKARAEQQLKLANLIQI
jgi:hypothetical protein